MNKWNAMVKLKKKNKLDLILVVKVPKNINNMLINT